MDFGGARPKRWKKKRGHTTCNNCGKVYNNNSVPRFCSCDHYLGGQGKSDTLTSITGALMITAALASVRSNERGENVRTFACLGKDKKVTVGHFFNYFNNNPVQH